MKEAELKGDRERQSKGEKFREKEETEDGGRERHRAG